MDEKWNPGVEVGDLIFRPVRAGDRPVRTYHPVTEGLVVNCTRNNRGDGWIFRTLQEHRGEWYDPALIPVILPGRSHGLICFADVIPGPDFTHAKVTRVAQNGKAIWVEWVYADMQELINSQLAQEDLASLLYRQKMERARREHAQLPPMTSEYLKMMLEPDRVRYNRDGAWHDMQLQGMAAKADRWLVRFGAEYYITAVNPSSVMAESYLVFDVVLVEHYEYINREEAT